MCNNSCNECCRKIYSDGVSVVTVNDIDTLVINVPEQSFRNGHKGCLVIVQNIPITATINMPVAISIGGDTTTVYPVVNCNCSNVTACQLRTRRRYPFNVLVNGTTAVFRITRNLSCAPCGNDIIPATTTTTTGGITI